MRYSTRISATLKVATALLFVFTAFFVTSIPSFAQAGLNIVEHDPAAFAPAGRPLTITARVGGNYSPAAVEAATLWYRQKDQSSFSAMDMFLEGMMYSTTLSPSEVHAPGLEYYIEFTMMDGASHTYPFDNPIGNPVQVAIRTEELEQADSPLILISPEPFSQVTDEILIAIGFNQSMRTIDPAKVRLKINSKDFTKKATVSTELLVATLDNLKPGRQRLQVFYNTDSGPELLGDWAFTYKGEMSTLARFGDNLSGNVGLEARQQSYSGVSEGIARETFALRYNTGKFFVQTNGILTSEEQGNLQPQHRFLLKAGFPALQFSYGDVRPRHNELILWSRRVRGLAFDLNTKVVSLQAIHGELARGIDGNMLIQSMVDPDATTQTVYDTTITPGTYKRMLSAARFAFGDKDGFQLGFSAMKVKDDTSSIEHGIRPKDNLVTGVDMSWYADRRRFSLNAQTALSLTNDNILEAPLSDAESFKNIIWINQYFDPLPDEGLPISNDETGEDEDLDMKKVANSVLSNALSYKGRMRMRYFRNDLQAGYRFINRSFRSFGNPSLVNDTEGYFLQDRIRLFNGRIYLNGGYDMSWDNVNDKGDIRNTKEVLQGGFTLYTPVRYPDMTFTYRTTNNSNDGKIDIYEVQPADGPNPAINDTIDTRRENDAVSINVSLNQRFNLLSTRNEASLSVLNYERSDKFSELGDAENQSLTMKLRTTFEEIPLITTVTISNSGINSVNGMTDLAYNMIGLRGEYFLFNRKLIPYVNPRITLSSGENTISPIDPATHLSPGIDPSEIRSTTARYLDVDFTRIEWMAGFRWEFIKNQLLRGDLRVTTFSENSQYVYWDDHKLDANSVVKHDDKVFSLTYQIRF